MKKVVLRIYLCFGFVLITALLLNHIFTTSIRNFYPEEVINRESGGLLDLKSVLGKIHESSKDCRPVQFILGSSVSKKLDFPGTYNLSYLGPAARVQKYVVKALISSFQACPERKVSFLFELNPPVYTKRSVQAFQDKNMLKEAYLMDSAQLLTLAFENPSRAITLGMLKLHNYYPPEILWRILQKPQTVKLSRDDLMRHFDKFYDLRPADFDLEEIYELENFLKAMSEYKLGIYLPPHNPSWRYSIDGEKRIENLISKLSRYTSFPIIRADQEKFSEDEFRDPLHLTPNGSEHFQAIVLRGISGP